MPDKYAATWVSHSSIGDYLKCPRAYYLRNVYKNPQTGRKMTLASPALSLGQAVHAALENLKTIPVETRLSRDLLADFDGAWAEVSGERGGFKSAQEEAEMKERGRGMIRRVVKNPGPIARKTVRLKAGKNDMPPNFYLSEEENIILCGFIDWIEHREDDDSVRIIDFKTGKNEEDADSLQLPIYLLLMEALQKRRVSGAAYWYLEKDDAPISVPLPDARAAREKVLKAAREVKAARGRREFHCPRPGGCFFCRPYEAVLRGEARLVGTGGYGQDVYVL